ncbi:uncharacterized protein TNCV_2864451 [Trichonephila clavipes]|nr:uncharacterized protein TNCV_2864451 [Trichonephila clavipes]
MVKCRGRHLSWHPPLLTTTPHQREDISALDRFNVHRCPTRRVFSGTRLEHVTRQATVRYLYHSATAAALTQDEIDRYIHNSDELSELSENGLEYSDDCVDFYLIVGHLMKIRIVTVKIVLVHYIQFRI